MWLDTEPSEPRGRVVCGSEERCASMSASLKNRVFRVVRGL